ncbi:MAG: (d)CMP kinase [Verrucomicrobiae bacterium]
MTVIAIDGPAASGKSSVSLRLARRLGFAYVNSGSMYRAVTWEVLRQGAETASPESVGEALARAEISCGIGEDNESFIRMNGEVLSSVLRDSEINRHVSPVSAVPAVRERISTALRELAHGRPLVMEGRDIGTAVFPETPFKFYLDASPEIRQKRREAEGGADQIAARDQMDSSRKAAPLQIAPGASVVDTSLLTLDGVVDEILRLLHPLGIVPK